MSCIPRFDVFTVNRAISRIINNGLALEVVDGPGDVPESDAVEACMQCSEWGWYNNAML